MHVSLNRWRPGNLSVISFIFCIVGSVAFCAPLARASEQPDNSSASSAVELSTDEVALADRLVIEFNDSASPVVSGYCYDCHNADYSEAGVELDRLDPDMVRGDDAEHWHAALDMVNSGEMPPDDGEQPSDDERRALVDWITRSLDAARSTRRGSEQPLLRRLTKRQYANTLSDLLELPIELGRDLPDDSPSELGFRNSAAAQQTTSLHFQYYESVAREALGKAIVTGHQPAPAKYRVTLGRDVGKDGNAARIGGFQSMPIEPEHVSVEVLDHLGRDLADDDKADQAKRLQIEKNIGIGMRGSHSDRFFVAKDGIVLDSALPHKEVSPKSWQGPSPNLKLLLRNCAPDTGPFRLLVKASPAGFTNELPTGLISLLPTEPLVDLISLIETKSDSARAILEADDFRRLRNAKIVDDTLLAKDVTKTCGAEAKLFIEQDGLYQIDLVHPVTTAAAMPSISVRIGRKSEQVRLDAAEAAGDKTQLVTPITHANFKSGEYKLKVGGRFFAGLSHLVVTRLTDDHPVAKQITSSSERNSQKYAEAVPALRVFVGARTDDGMEYATFGESTPVLAASGDAAAYEFNDYIENLPVPTYDQAEKNPLSNIMIVGMWNDHLVKSRKDQGPPLRIESIEFEAPYHPVWPPKSHTAILFDDPLRDSNPDAYTRRVLRRFMTRAFRRPVEPAEVNRYFRFWKEVRSDFDTYEDGIREALVAVLCSPSFLYIDRPFVASSLPANDEATQHDDHKLATRLSFFLWNSPPDAKLLKLARRGKLREQLAPVVNEMVLDARAWRFVRTFAAEWLRLDRHETMQINVDAFPDYSRFVKRDMREETFHFLRHAITENLSAGVLIDSDFAMLNQNLAEFYRIDGVEGPEFRRVALDSAVGRGGLLSQGAFLAGHSDGTQSHPIKRAVWMKERILGDPPPPPPPNVPELDPETPGFEKLTLKEQLELHRNKPSCVDCHRKIDPYGVVFEEYDAVGRRRTHAAGKPVDTASELPDGSKLNGVADLKRYVLEERYDMYLRSLCEHLFAYATGREITYAEQPEIDQLVAAAKQDDRLGSIILAVVQSDSFLRPTPIEIK